jgi:hypothetical protein
MATFADKEGADGLAAPPQQAVGVIVLGTGRSGTSAITRAFVKGGFFAGEERDLLGAAPSNPVGHYEPLSILKVNEELLRDFGCYWWSDAPAPEEQLRRREELVPRLRETLESLIAAADDAPVAIKEPRINGLLPLWQPVVDGVLHPVLTVRDPLEVALSHAHRDGTSMSHALASWEGQTTQVLLWLDGRTATIAPYAQLTSQPGLATELIHAAAKHIDPARTDRLRPSEAGSALRRDLHRQTAAELDRDEYLTGRQAALWEYLRGLSPGDARLDIPAKLREPSMAAQAAMRKESEHVELRETHAALAAEHSELKERSAMLEQRFEDAIVLAHQAVAAAAERADNATARADDAARTAATAEERRVRQMAGLESSLSWRITAPLRRLKRVLGRLFRA